VRLTFDRGDKMTVGDEVTVFAGNRIQGIYKIDKVTPTGIVKIGDASYNPDGWRRGDNSWNRESIELTTQEHRDFIKKRKMIKFIDGTDFSEFTIDELSEIITVINSNRSKKDR
jgi:hypothetical protein